MQLKSLQIQGFKSFPDKTTLHFDQGITAVVGPNGSGKSNISDAMGWVMGEQSVRNLRGEKMEDVIFLGSDKRKPTGYAFVSLTFDNRDRELAVDNDEVTISRKLYRSGESEYRINSAAVRLKDINELLMDTGLGRDGYSIIGQGRIDEIVSAKSSQRREIFEEAAGISKFRYRKEEAEKKLQAAYENLLRLKDILAELEERVEPLRLQSEKAQKFLLLSDEKKKLEVSLWIHSLGSLSEKLEQQEALALVAKNRLSDTEAVLEEYAARLEESYGQVQRCSVEIEAKRSQSSALTESLGKIDAAIAVLENDILHNSRSIQDLQQELNRYSQNQNALLETIEKNQKEQGAGKEKLKALKEETLSLEQRYQELSANYHQAAEAVVTLKSRRNAYEQNIALQKLNRASSSTLLEETRQRLLAVEQNRQNRKENWEALEQELKNSQQFLHSIGQKELSLQNSQKGYELKRSSRKRHLDELLEQQRQLLQESERKMHQAKVLSDMERSMEGFQNSVKQVMQAGKSGKLRGIHGSVSQLLSTSTDYALAIETALGASMQSIVVDNEDSAKAAIQYLKFSRGGRATFLPLTTIKPQALQASGIEREEGFCGVASRLIRCEARYRSIMENLLGRIVVAQTIDHAVEIARKYGYKFRIVTLDGQLVNAGGSLTGGSTVKNAGLLSRRADIERLTAEAKEFRDKSDGLEPEIAQLKQETASVEAELASIDAQLRMTGEDRITCQSEIKRLTVSLEEMKQTDEADEKEYKRIQKRLEEVEKNSSSSEERIAQASRELETVFSELELRTNERNELTARCQTIQNQMNEKRFQILSLSKDLEALAAAEQRMLNSQNEQKDLSADITARIQTLKDKNTQASQEIKAQQRTGEQARQDIQQIAKDIQELYGKQTQLERKLTEMREQEKQYISEKERASGEMQRYEEKRLSLQIEYDKLIARLWDEYSLTRSQAEEIAAPLEDNVKANGRLLELKNQIRALGSINVEAIEEYREVSQRYRFLKEQIDDVEKSRSELIRLIRDLTSQMRELFLTSFQEISRHFSTIFAELFGGGKGELLLLDPEDVLNSGIDIRVQPPGKIIKSLTALSGGEKALVAIAIYFSILKVKPSSFCILDEIEAALDEVNVSRYAAYLRKLTGKTQFISITHRRGTMEEADVLYGVTMQEKGVSRLIELDVTQVESKLGIKTAEK
ncbi:MAG: chromosome segregation protein SMC [Negativibacillus sp.]